MKIGYVAISHQVMKEGKSVGYLYREATNDSDDSGWRVFSGEESQDYVDDPLNFAFYNASTLLEREPALANILLAEFPIAFERDASTSEYRVVDN